MPGTPKRNFAVGMVFTSIVILIPSLFTLDDGARASALALLVVSVVIYVVSLPPYNPPNHHPEM